MLQILFFAVVAALVLARLYQVLGQNRGAEPPPMRRDRTPGPVTGPDSPEPGGPVDAPLPVAVPRSASDVPGVDALMAADRAFDPDTFVDGARAAYEMIVTAYGRGDEATLRPLVDDDVFAAYQAAMEERRAANAKPIEVVRLSGARLVRAEVEAGMARVDVAFSSDLADGGDGLRATDEVWTFERRIDSRDPNWRLSAVETA